MSSLILATLASLSLASFQPEPPRSGGLPLKVPEGWESTKEEAALVMTPKGLAAGTLYAVVVPVLAKKVGSLKGLIDAGKETLGEIGTFKPHKEPVHAKNDAGWEYDVVIGTVEKEGGAVIGQIVALQKGDDEGLVLLVSDSVETMGKYSDAFTTMIRSLGGGKPAPVAGRAAKVDLKFTVPDGWTKKEEAGSILLEASEQPDVIVTVFRVLILPSEPLQGSVLKTFQELWALQLKPAVESSAVPTPFMLRLKSGAVCAFDVDDEARNKTGDKLSAGLYVLARGKRVVPILVFFLNYYGNSPTVQKGLAAILESAEIPDAGTDPIALFAASDLEGEWSEFSSNMANYVTRGGDYAGDASVSTGEWMILNKDGSFKTVHIALKSTKNVKETVEGTWTLEDNVVILTDKERVRRYTVFAYGTDPKVGAFLVRSSYPNSDQQPYLFRPRRSNSGTWLKRKQ